MLQNYDDIVNIENLMKVLDIGRNTAYKLLRTGELQLFKVGKVYKIPKKCIEEYI
ncbi:helix-turn-helix domain-containing protein [Aneurinibacillus aneurinilyticus]|nr:helix-turn-helix domain-containing protein [Aneurinibacillus aneurinilyticus]MED0705264.1 helix-turn-helix domain-containing protein [Aneurinibacillus aneurinilyticus]MED0722488.1 helix-turn-helix domain-containing protein [Aneurinibacillus aneurinilyticus]MED0733798.1 helix-turn-helix domain-containing protein [Aneurinibacillus aneurinilyticus]MED0739681.1 helix-turn-helix domain-containing protein [Aneurinibacillus aneurinilyticus]